MALVDVTVKTLSGQNYIFSVPEEITVKSFKDKISGSISIPADTQRLIYRGRVIQDDKPLKDYDLHGKAIHVVQRAPPTSAQPGVGSSRASENPPPNLGRPHPPDGGLLDVQIHVGSINADPNPREARNRIIQAELNLGIINDALNLLEERTGISTRTAASEESQESMDTSQPAPQEDRDRQQQSERGPQAQGTRPNGGRQDSATGLMATELADVLDRVLSTSDRITPQLRLYRNYLRNEESYTSSSQEARNAQEVVNRVSEAMHAMSHVMHNLSDLMVDMNMATPRRVVAAPMSPFMTGGSSMAIPIHMNVRSRPNGNGQRQSPQEPAQTSATTTSSSAASTTTTAASSTPQTATFSSSTSLPFDIPGLQPGTAGVSVMQDIHAAVVTSDELMGGVDVPLPGGPATTSITVVSATTGDDPAAPEQPTATTVTSIGVTPPVSSAAVISTSETRPSSQPPTSTTSSFSYGPTTNVNIIGMPNVSVGSLPNVPGLPGGVLQNIVQSILGQHVVPPGQPLHVNVHPNTTVGRIRIPLLHPQNANGAQNQTRGQQTPSSMDASTATRTNAATNTSQAGPTPSTSTTGTNTTGQNINPTQGVGNNSSSIGTVTDPGMGTNNRSTNTPQGPIIFSQRPGRGRAFAAGPRPSQPRPSRPGEAPNRPTGATNGGGRGFVDVTLPCASHHYHSQSARQMTRNARNRGQQQQVPNLSTMVSGMVGDIFGQVGQAHQVRPNGNQQTSSGSTATTNTSATTSSSGTPPMPEVFNPLQMFASMMGGAVPGMPGGQGSQMPFDLTSMITSMMGVPPAGRPSNGQGNTNSNVNETPVGNAPTMGGTLADLLQHVQRSVDPNSGENESAESSPLQGLIEAVAPHLRLMDILSLLMGNSHVLDQVQGTMRTFVESGVTEHGSVEAFVQAAVDGINEEINYVSTLSNVKADIDMAASIRMCLTSHLDGIFNAILSEAPTYAMWRQMFAGVIGLFVYCLQDGTAGFSSVIQRYLPHLSQVLNPAIMTLMATSLQDIDMLGSFHQNNPVPEDTLKRYIVKRSSAVSAGGSREASQSKAGDKHKESTTATTPTATTTTTTQEPPQATPKSDQTPVVAAAAVPVAAASDDVTMDTSVSPCSRPPRAKVPRTHEDTESDEEFVDAPREFTLPQSPRVKPSKTTPALSSSRNRGPQLVANGETSDQWQSVIPQEWIPVISRDIERQREQRPQPPLSDAYLQGLPPKRRRMMVLEHAAEMSNMHHYLPSSVARAAHAAGVEPISSEQNLIQEATEEKELQDSLEEEVQSSLEGRISTDNDFNADRFPNSKEYFHKSKRH